jgi:hypothetical protein
MSRRRSAISKASSRGCATRSIASWPRSTGSRGELKGRIADAVRPLAFRPGDRPAGPGSR